MSRDSVHVAVRWPAMKAARGADFDCVITRDLKISPIALQDFSAQLLKPVEQDLVLVAGAAAYADRKVRRKRAKGWSRDIVVTVPVRDPKFWSRTENVTALTDALNYVSGDYWTFQFVADSSETLVKRQSALDFTRGNYVVLPFSDGMDSFLQWQLLKKEERDVNLLRVHTSSRATSRDRNRRIDASADRSDQRLGMPVTLSIGDHAEPTYRTRTFLFFVMAALAAHKSAASRVVIGENGVGMLGPSMVPFGDECPHRTTHPAFTRRLATFLDRVLDGRITFDHPQRFRTKGQVLRHADNLGVSGWEASHSCTRGTRNELDSKPCGICGGCLLRRTAVHAAGLRDEVYFWDDLSGQTLDDCRSDPEGRPTRRSDVDVGVHGIFDMTTFGELGADTTPPDVFDRAAWEIVGKADPVFHSSLRKYANLRNRTLPSGQRSESASPRTGS